MIGVTPKDVMENTDGGATWKVVATYPADPPPQSDSKYGVGSLNLGYDPTRDLFYVCPSVTTE